MSDYFDFASDSGNRLVEGSRARAVKVNAIFDLISSGFDKFPDETTLNAYWAAISGLTAGSGVAVSLNDATIGYLNGKLVAGEAIDLTENNDGGAETLTVSCEDASATNKGVVELATNAETVTGTDTARAITPANLTARLAAPGQIGETTPNTIKLSSLGLKLVDLGGDNVLTIRVNEDLGSDRILNIVVGDGTRTFTLNENLTIGDGYNVTITAEDSAGSIVLDNCGFEVEDATNSGNIVKLINANDDTDKTISLSENLTIGAGANVTITAEDAAGAIVLDNCGLEIEDTANAGNIIKLINANDDTDKSITLNENLTIGAGANVSIIAEDAAGAIVLDNCGFEVEDVTNSGNIVKLINTGSDTDKTIALAGNINTANDIFPAATVMLFGQNAAPTGWTRKTDWTDTSMLCYAASGDCAAGGAVSPYAAHTHIGPSHNHQWYQHNSGTNDESYNSSGTEITLTSGDTTDMKIYAAHTVTAKGLNVDCYTSNAGTGATGANTAPYYQEVIAATKD